MTKPEIYIIMMYNDLGGIKKQNSCPDKMFNNHSKYFLFSSTSQTYFMKVAFI